MASIYTDQSFLGSSNQQHYRQLPVTQEDNTTSLISSQLKQQQQLLQQHLPPQQHLQSQQQQKQQQHQTNYSIPKDGILPGGRLSKFAHNWKKITSQNWPLSIVQNGYQLQFITTPSPWKAKKIHHSPADQLAVDVAVDKFLKAGIIYRSPTTQNRDYLSNFFTVQEPTKRRPILDCTNLNKFLQIHHFKMEGIPALREEIIEQDDYMCKIDLKDAYVVVPIHKDSQPFLALENRGIVYNYSSLAFGLSVAPRVFTKLMRDAVEPLRAQGIRLIYYLDNFCILEKSKHKMMNTVHLVMNHLRELGFLINMEKSVITPSKIQEFLGFKINSRDMQISLPQVKINKILQRIKQVEKTPRRSCRWIASLLGKITAVIPAVSEALLHIRHIQRDLAKSLQVNRHRWDYDCVLSAKAKLEIQWWKDNLLQKNDLPIHHLPPLSLSALTIHVDASDTGWGVHSKVISKAGYWTGRERQESINVRELTAVYYYALRLHVKDSNFLTEINLHTDNMTALKYVTKSGGTASTALQDLAVKIQDLCNLLHQLKIRYHHVAGVRNTEADRLSRSGQPMYESSIPRTFFNLLKKRWGRYWRIDAFAASHNHQLRQYWSLHHDPFAQQSDAFQQDWTSNDMYMFPPWKLIPQVLRKLQLDRTREVTLITPMWPTQFWFPMLLRMKQLSPPIVWQTNRWSLIGWHLSPRNGRRGA